MVVSCVIIFILSYMKVVFATDHAGFELKNILLAYVRDELGYEVVDMGALAPDPLDDYTDFVGKAAEAVAESPKEVRAIVLGGSGQGEAMHANRFKGVRAAVYYGGTLDIVRLSREHNDANVLALGARFLDVEEARGAVALWLSTGASGDVCYARRIGKMDV
jgi:ribose 5-phosphate isomerase B